MFKYIAIATFLALISFSQGEEHVARKLGYSKCKTVVDLSNRCCGDDLSACTCPVRECTAWYCGWIQWKWNRKCDYYESRYDSCTLVAVIDEDDDLGTLLTAVAAAGLAETVATAEALTIFAPTDEAFAAIPSDILTCLLEPDNVDTLTSILLYHVVGGTVLSTDLSDGPVTTLQGESVTVDISESGVKINESNVTAVDIAASNGVVHKIDSVLLPPVAGLGSCAP